MVSDSELRVACMGCGLRSWPGFEGWLVRVRGDLTTYWCPTCREKANAR